MRLSTSGSRFSVDPAGRLVGYKIHGKAKCGYAPLRQKFALQALTDWSRAVARAEDAEVSSTLAAELPQRLLGACIKSHGIPQAHPLLSLAPG